MPESVSVQQRTRVPLEEFLMTSDFLVERITDSVLQVSRENEMPVFVHINEHILYFEVDLGGVDAGTNREVLFKLLDLNTEILPVSVGIDTANPDDLRLVLVESRETANLDSNELLSVFNAMEIAAEKVENLLRQFIK